MPAQHVIAIANGKGGVGKTSLVANIAGVAASSQWRVLAIDLDPQGNLARDLGYLDRSDGGDSLFAAAYTGAALEPIYDVRTFLDVIPGGPATRRLGDQLRADAISEGPNALDKLDRILDPLFARYDLVLLDLPPGEAVVQQASLRCASHIVIPTTGDAASNDGLGAVYEQVLTARAVNPLLDVLGVVVTFVANGASAMTREIRADLDQTLQGKVRLFEPPVRHARRAAMDCRQRGLLAYEYELAKANALPWYEARQRGLPVQRFAQNASGLAEDYQRLTETILQAAGDRVTQVTAG